MRFVQFYRDLPRWRAPAGRTRSCSPAGGPVSSPLSLSAVAAAVAAGPGAATPLGGRRCRVWVRRQSPPLAAGPTGSVCGGGWRRRMAMPSGWPPTGRRLWRRWTRTTSDRPVAAARRRSFCGARAAAARLLALACAWAGCARPSRRGPLPRGGAATCSRDAALRYRVRLWVCVLFVSSLSVSLVLSRLFSFWSMRHKHVEYSM